MDLQMNWNPADLFRDAAAWQQKLHETRKLADELAARNGHAADSAAGLLETAHLFEEINSSFEQLGLYAACRFHPDMSNETTKNLMETVSNAESAFREKIAFLTPELMRYSMEDFNRYAKELPELEIYRTLAAELFAKKPHVLDTKGEEMLTRISDLGSSYRKIFDDLTVNDTVYPTVDGPDGEPVPVTESGYGSALQSPDRRFRRDYFEGLLGSYGKHIHVLSSNYSGAMKAQVYEARSRNYPTARAQALTQNQVPEEVYDNLIQNVRAGVKPLQDYVSLRKQILGIADFHFYDFFVPIVPDIDRAYSYEEGKKLVLKATAILGDDYTEVVERAFAERWIDVFPEKNKMTGAYSSGAYGAHPYMLLNYTNTLDDVFTLAHEMGHSMHTYFSAATQPYVYADYSIFCAEVASTTNEMLLYRYLLDRADSKEQKALLLSKHLDDIRSTFYRQTMFADFENQTHALAEAGEPLLPSTLCGIHQKLNADYYGKDFIADPTISYEWARIPHFSSHFYVYQYATGISAAIAIARRIRSEGAPAVADYRKFLTTGGSQSPIDLLRIAGVDMASPQPILDTIADFAETLAELKKLL